MDSRSIASMRKQMQPAERNDRKAYFTLFHGNKNHQVATLSDK